MYELIYNGDTVGIYNSEKEAIKLIKDNQQVEQQPSFVIERREPSDREIY